LFENDKYDPLRDAATFHKAAPHEHSKINQRPFESWREKFQSSQFGECFIYQPPAFINSLQEAHITHIERHCADVAKLVKQWSRNFFLSRIGAITSLGLTTAKEFNH